MNSELDISPDEQSVFIRRIVIDRVVRSVVAVLTGLVIFVVVAILWYVASDGIPALSASFFTDIPAPIGTPGGGIGQAIAGTAEMLFFASLMAIPIGTLTAIYLAEYGQGTLLNSVIRFTVEVLASLPSIVVGVFVWALLVRQITGFSGWAGAVALAIVMVPIIARTLEEILRLVKSNVKESALSVGMPRWRMILQVAIPSVFPGLITGVLLSVARAAGETAPLLMTSLGNEFFNSDMRRPMAAMTLQIYNYALSPYKEWHNKASLAVLTLIVIVSILNASLAFVIYRIQPRH